MSPAGHRRLERVAVVGIFAVAAAVTLLVVVGIMTSAGYVPQ